MGFDTFSVSICSVAFHAVNLNTILLLNKNIVLEKILSTSSFLIFSIYHLAVSAEYES